MVDKSYFETVLAQMQVYASNPTDPAYIAQPTFAETETGMDPLDTLPAQYWNWFLNAFTDNFNAIRECTGNAIGELDGILNIMGITPDKDVQTQLKTFFASTYLENYAPKVIESLQNYAITASHSASFEVADGDGNGNFEMKKVPYIPPIVFCSSAISAAKTITIPTNFLQDGQVIKVMFTNGHNAASLSSYMTLNGYPILVNQNGSLVNLPIHTFTNVTPTEYRCLQANTVLEMFYKTNYDGNNNNAWVVIGNPIVLSSTYYSIFADGKNSALETMPVGYLFFTSDSQNPGVYFRGTWTQITDKFIYAAGNKTVNSTGGLETVTLTTSNMPSHNHGGSTGNIDHSLDHRHTVKGDPETGSEADYMGDIEGGTTRNRTPINTTYITGVSDQDTDATLKHTHSINAEGGGQAHENMPPYIVKYCWERTA